MSVLFLHPQGPGALVRGAGPLFFFYVRGEARGFVSRRLSSQSVTFPIVSLLLLREVAVRAVTRQPSGGLCDQFSRG